ncbi:hypothetical protein V8B97DRAFT_2008831 [Scleroderma yunnanense]
MSSRQTPPFSPDWARLTSNSNLPPFEYNSDPGPSQTHSHSQVEQSTGAQNMGYSYNFTHQMADQGNLHAQSGGEMSTGFVQPLHSDGPYQRMEYLLYPASDVDISTHMDNRLLYPHLLPHSTTAVSGGYHATYQNPEVPQYRSNPMELFGELFQGSSSGGTLPVSSVSSHTSPQVPSFRMGYGEGTTGQSIQIAQSSQIGGLFPGYMYSPRAGSPHNRSVGASMNIAQDASAYTGARCGPLHSPCSPEQVCAMSAHGHSTVRPYIYTSIGTNITALQAEREILPRNDPTFRAEGSISAPSFGSGTFPLPSRVPSDPRNIPGRGPQIPQERYSIMAAKNLFNRQDPIVFNLKDSTAQGIPISDALQGGGRHLEGAKDPIITLEKTSISLRILWPGYPSWSKALPTKTWGKHRAALTRAHLAKRVAEQIKKFYNERCNDHVTDPDGKLWKIGSGEIQLDDLVLVSLRHVSQGSWQPALCLRNPRPSLT